MSEHWTRLCNLSECPPGEAREFVAGGRMVALFHTEEGVQALDGICPHQGGPLGKGRLAGCVVTCPWHGWQFHVATGKHVTSPLVHTSFPVRLEGDEVFVELPEIDRPA